MTETKNEKFERMLDVRLPKALKAVSLLENLSGRDYESYSSQRRALVDQLYDAVDGVADAFGVAAAEAEPAAPEPASEPVSEDGEPTRLTGTDLSYVRWAYDMLRRGETKAAKSLLHDTLQRAIDEGR